MVGVVYFNRYVGVFVGVWSVEYWWCVLMVGWKCYREGIGCFGVVLGVLGGID